MMIGFAVRNNRFTICGTAIPTNDTGPANAVTTADKMLDKITSNTRNILILTPIFLRKSLLTGTLPSVLTKECQNAGNGYNKHDRFHILPCDAGKASHRPVMKIHNVRILCKCHKKICDCRTDIADHHSDQH